MKIKRFNAPTMRLALAAVRREQGPDAVILSNRRADNGVEVVAAVDYDETLIHQPADPSTDHQALADSPEQNELSSLLSDDTPFSESLAVSDESKSNASKPVATEMTAVRQELTSMRSLLTEQLSQMAWQSTCERSPERAAVLQQYAAMGIHAGLAQELADRVADCFEVPLQIENATRVLAEALPLPDQDMTTAPGIVALIGPTGVGKTTTIAKLAAIYALKYGRDQVALVSTDSFRIGAQEQLATFARILDVPALCVNEAGELSDVLRGLSDKQLVLIDTAGVSQRARGLADHLQALHLDDASIRTYLTLAANAQEQTLDDVVRHFGDVPLDGCVLTKIDEATSLGPALSVAIRRQLPITLLANGQRVPEDLHSTQNSGQTLIDRAERLAQEEAMEHGDEFMARHFAEGHAHVFA
ncbi:MAG: flagellar biosynthesis protein FlhF [Pseudomonadota bacterium]